MSSSDERGPHLVPGLDGAGADRIETELGVAGERVLVCLETGAALLLAAALGAWEHSPALLLAG